MVEVGLEARMSGCMLSLPHHTAPTVTVAQRKWRLEKTGKKLKNFIKDVELQLKLKENGIMVIENPGRAV